MTALVDRFGRRHDYLRISVTDRCNLRCVYCMPEDMAFLPQRQLLTDDEIVAVVRVAAQLGVRKLRITGGEPLVRPGLADLVARLAAIPGIEDIALTTNGIFLAEQAEALRRAGVRRVNVSLDSLKPDRFRRITRRGELERVLEGIEQALAVGFSPVKLNCVLVKGVNDDEIVDFIRLTLERPLHVRFIEYMPIGHHAEWKAGYVPLTDVLARAEAAGLPLEPADDAVPGNGPAEVYRVRGALGTVGLIHPVSDHFCAGCNRLRLTADGYLKPCLYWVEELRVRDCIGDEEKLRALFFRALALKPEKHEMARAGEALDDGRVPTWRRMSQIGG
ncbi:GTP 3',8-cyclase MoaA [Calditerricola satsumensis]|uniref:GTP 3',8-cyclase n=2 Tax=Calditerricola satsumensis TaxID=373054 RepID=A0A8J3B7D4_9BACI|nr:GTP 3',8-cyclase MoaA [Calditerricola satsumensis]GGK01036.1 GTP 3',8-cyclase [Calditerricola satsumensis]